MFTVESLRNLAREAGHVINGDVHRFIDWIERKHAGPDLTVAQLQAQQAAQADPSPAPQAPEPTPAPTPEPTPAPTPEPTPAPAEQPAE